MYLFYVFIFCIIYSGNLALEAERILTCRLQTGGWCLPSLLDNSTSVIIPGLCHGCARWAEPGPCPAAGRSLAKHPLSREFQQGSEATAYKSPERGWWVLCLSRSCYKIEVVEGWCFVFLVLTQSAFAINHSPCPAFSAVVTCQLWPRSPEWDFSSFYNEEQNVQVFPCVATKTNIPARLSSNDGSTQ